MSNEGGERFGPGSIPVTFKSGNIELPGKSAQVAYEGAGDSKLVTPDAAEVAHFMRIKRTCGECKHFDKSEKAKAEISNEQFYKRLVREEGWKLHHLGSDPSSHGLCAMKPGTLTGELHKGCDHFSQNNGLITITAKR